MIADPAVIPGLLLLAAQLAALTAVGFVVVRRALRPDDELSALAQGLVVGPALWGLIVNFVMYAVPGLAGAAVGWAVTLILGAALVWRSPGRLRPPARAVAGFAGAVLVLGWAALASRQLVGIANPHIDLGLAASIRAGGFPVSLPWHPEAPASYHYGASLLVGLLAPPLGPDLAFVWELLGVYAWVSFVLVVVTALRQRGSWLAAVLLAPLLLSYGLHTFIWSDPSRIAGILWLPLPAGLPAAGLRASLAGIYWPPFEPVGSRLSALPDVWKPVFPFGYAMAFVVLAHAARSKHATWLGSLTLAGLVGFLGLLVTTLAPVVAVLWAGLDALRLARARGAGAATLALRSGAGLAVAGLLLLFGGGAISGTLGGGAGSSGLTWARSLDASHWQVLGAFDARRSGVGLLSLGPLAVVGAATALARRDRLALTLAAGATLLVLAWLALDYPSRPQDLDRLAGHSRNLALVALLLALSARLAGWRSRPWRYAAGALFAGLIVWPTIAAPARGLGIALGQGVHLANAGWARPASTEQGAPALSRRERLPGMSSHLAAYIRDHTAVDARVLNGVDAYWLHAASNQTVLMNTGRPNNQGFTGVVQLELDWGPEYLDARHYLEPAAFRRLGLTYVYATDAWAAALPARARGWLADPGLFDLLARDGDEAFYRVRSAFLALKTAPHPASFEALRSVPPGTVVYLPPQPDWRNQVRLLRVASVLSHARLVGTVNPQGLHLRTSAPWAVAPLGARVPELVVLPLLHGAWLFPPVTWRQVWRNPLDRVSVYALSDAVDPPPDAAPLSVSVRLDDVRAAAEGLTFTATLDARAPHPWTGQDWVLVPTDTSPWAIPVLDRHDGLPVIEQWFAGQAVAGGGTTTHTYVFDARASSLAVRRANGAFTTIEASKRTPSPGAWMLALRLNRRADRGVQETAFIIPVLRIEVSNAGTVSSYQVYDTAQGWRPP